MKLFAMLLSAALMLGMTACAEKNDDKDVIRMEPDELYTFAEENLSDLAPNEAGQLRSAVVYGEFVHETYHSKTLDRERNVNILLPPNYDENTKYPVLYALHGYWGDEYSLLDQGDGAIKVRQLMGNLVASGEAAPMIIVFPDIFCHETKEDCDGMNAENNAAYDNFINELEKDLMPYIEENYPVLRGRKSRAVTGFSMGGRESLYIGVKLADKFGYIGAVCPAPGLTQDCVTEDEMVFDDDNKPYILMISAGTDDTVVYNNPETYHNIFAKNGVQHIYHVVPGGGHWGNTIHPHFYNFLRFCFK